MRAYRRVLPRPSLLVRFSLISLLPILALGFVLGRDIQRNARSEAMHDARSLAVDVANLRIAPNLTRADLSARRLPPKRARRLERVLDDALQSSNVARAKLWARNGRVVFSDDKKLAGRGFEVEEDLGEALEGEVASEVTDLNHAEQERDRHLGKAVEVYVPLRFAAGETPRAPSSSTCPTRRWRRARSVRPGTPSCCCWAASACCGRCCFGSWRGRRARCAVRHARTTTRPPTTRSPACPTARPSGSAWTGWPATGAARWPCWTWTASRRSTTPSATTPGTRSCARWARGWRVRCPRTRWSHASAATSSRC